MSEAKIILKITGTNAGEIEMRVTLPGEHPLVGAVMEHAVKGAGPKQLPLKQREENGADVIECSEPNCSNPAGEFGRCIVHRCATAGCDGVPLGTGLCLKCMNRPAVSAVPLEKQCGTTGCTRVKTATGYCRKCNKVRKSAGLGA